MKCPFCAEEIKDEAVLCRFCGAAKLNDVWQPPAPPPAAQPGIAAGKSNFTIRFAAVFFLLSAGFEAISPTSPIPLLGAVRGGTVALAYHLLYFGLFLGMGCGLWLAKSWGYRLMFIGTLIYTLDRALYLLDYRSRAAQAAQELQGYGVQDMMDPGSIVTWGSMIALLSLACWWGFLLYLHIHRSIFEAASKR